MSEVSMRAESTNRQIIMIPTKGAVQNLYDLLRRVEIQAKEMGINTGYGDFATYRVIEEDNGRPDPEQIGVFLETTETVKVTTPPIAVIK